MNKRQVTWLGQRPSADVRREVEAWAADNRLAEQVCAVPLGARMAAVSYYRHAKLASLVVVSPRGATPGEGYRIHDDALLSRRTSAALLGALRKIALARKDLPQT